MPLNRMIRCAPWRDSVRVRSPTSPISLPSGRLKRQLLAPGKPSTLRTLTACRLIAMAKIYVPVSPRKTPIETLESLCLRSPLIPDPSLTRVIEALLAEGWPRNPKFFNHRFGLQLNGALGARHSLPDEGGETRCFDDIRCSRRSIAVPT